MQFVRVGILILLLITAWVSVRVDPALLHTVLGSVARAVG